MRVMILVDDLQQRVKQALASGRTGDLEVIEYIANNNLTDLWQREGEKRAYPNQIAKSAIKHKLELRPKSDEVLL